MAIDRVRFTLEGSSARPGIWEGAPFGACAHAATLAGDHTTVRSGTLWRDTLRSILARAESVTAAHSSEYNTGAEIRP